MRQKRQRRIVRWQDKGRPDRLLSEELIHDSLLHPRYERLTESMDYRRVDPSGHESEGVARRNEAIMRFQVLEPPLNDSDMGQPDEPVLECEAHGAIGMDQPKTFKHPFSSYVSITQPP